MPDQIPPPSQPYGPFTDVLTGPLSGQRQQVMQQPSGWGGQGAALANYANAFIKSAQVGQREKLERSEMEKASHERNFDSVHAYIQNSDTISPEGKQAAEKAYLMGKFSQVADHASQGEKQNKDNPLFALTKAITGAVMGPGELKNHKDMAVDVNALLNIANDERFKIDPRKMAAEAGAGVADVLRGAAAGTPGSQGVAALPQGAGRPIAVPSIGSSDLNLEEYGGSGEVGPSTGPATVTGGQTAPEAGTPGVAAIPGKQLTQDEALRDPKIQGYLQGLAQQGISWDKDPYLSRLIGGLPKTGAPKLLSGTGGFATNPDTNRVEAYHRYQNTDGSIYNVFDGVAAVAKPTSNTGNLQHMWVKTPDGRVEVGFFNPRKPGGFMNVSGAELPAGTAGTVPPTDGAGQRGIYRNIARTIITNRGEAPTEASVDELAGQIAFQRMDTAMQEQQQKIGVSQAETGIGGGGGLNVGAPKPAPRQAPGLVEQGNINLNNRPVVRNADGSISTVRSKSFNFDGKEVLLPTVSDDGKILTDDQAIAQYRETGKHLGKFDSPANATAYAQSLHQQQAKQYVQPRTTPPPGAENQTGRLGAFKNQADYDDASLYYRSAMGAGAAPGKMSIRTERGANLLGKASGLNPAELVSAINENKADNEVLKTTVKNAAGFATLDKRISNHAGLLEQAMKDNQSFSDVPVGNMTYQYLQSHLTDYPELKKLEVAVNALQREYGSLLGNSPTSSRSVPVSFQNEANKLINPATPIKTMVAAIQQIRKESGATQKAFKDMLTEQRDKVNQDPISRAFGRVEAAPAETGPGRGGNNQDAGGVVSFIVKTPKDGEHTVTVKASDAEAKKKQILATPGYSIR